MEAFRRSFGVLVLLVLVSACGNAPEVSAPVNVSNEDFVVRSRATIELGMGGAVSTLPNAATGSQTVTVVNSPNSLMALNNAQFSLPAVSNTMLDFGSLALSTVFDNDLKVCGANGHTKCTKALIRVYTTGPAGAGLYNATDGYGMPITASVGTGSAQTIGLSAAAAITLQQITIASSKNVIRQSDFPVAVYNILSDFTDAGAGSYSTTLVIEYGLAL